MEKKLNELGVKYGTDKSSLLHDYLVEYEKYFKNPEDVQDILEIGLQRGGKWRNENISPSLAMWGEFFPKATLYGFDIKNLKFNDPRVRFFRGDQGSVFDVMKFANATPKFDFIIDDGSHYADHQMITFLALWPKVKSGGIYIIEDMNPVVQRELKKENKIHSLIENYTKEFEHYWVDSKNSGPKSSLVLIKK